MGILDIDTYELRVAEIGGIIDRYEVITETYTKMPTNEIMIRGFTIKLYRELGDDAYEGEASFPADFIMSVPPAMMRMRIRTSILSFYHETNDRHAVKILDRGMIL